MIRYRSFLNGDPPVLAEIWRSHAAPRSITQPLSAALFQETVLSKPYFDSAGLIVALDDERPIGFAHAGFGPTADGGALDVECGIVCTLVMRPTYWEGTAPAGLLAQCEAYLWSHGAKTVWGGGARCYSPFYMGLLGGSRQYGVPDSDPQSQHAFRTANYSEVDRFSVRHRELRGFRPPINRKLMQLRRQSSVTVVTDPPAESWWDACTVGACEQIRFEIRLKEGGSPCAAVTFWNMEPLSQRWGVRAAGMLGLWVEPQRRRQGLATFLLCEAFRQLEEQGLSLVEVQSPCGDAAACSLFASLSLNEVDQGVMFAKERITPSGT